ncbi:FxSxx-COOH system tetratricopeptide repeat protein [Amycolatopsis alba]|uniref:NTPase n=1 Tax=Amycolatopsis alba DSM 44262 TaxID=1125972 RepID=A0A229RG32_AMYAL|nr:FxSxx-COOH system tetratricopeptide repeat protein [Amycolatopsis alba]OXM45354.1 NTPase [Amycolatopsis alba DSM 44262]
MTHGDPPLPGGQVVRDGPPTIWYAVPPRNPRFVGRESVLKRMRENFSRGHHGLALTGMGGIGKTQIALEYVFRHVDEYDAVWWTSATDLKSVRDSFAELGQQIGVGRGTHAALRALAGDVPPGKWLVVLDGVPDFTEIDGYLPRGPHVHFIVTSRDSQSHVHKIDIDVFTRLESVRLLTLRDTGMTVQDADRIAEAMGDLPLALEQAAAWIAVTGDTPENYLSMFDNALKELTSTGELPQPDLSATWTVSLRTLSENHPGAELLLGLLTFFEAGWISRADLKTVPTVEIPAALERVLTDAVEQSRALRELNRYMLVKIDHYRGVLQVHRLVRAAVQQRLDEDTADQLGRLASVLEDRVAVEVEWSTDTPAEVDLLKRDALAATLTQRLTETRQRDPRSSLLIHLDGAWGSGKSTLLNFLGRRLAGSGYLVVRFDAWQQSRLSPPWWALLSALRRKVVTDRRLWERGRFRLRETAERARRSGAPYLLALILLAVTAGGLALVVRAAIGGAGPFAEVLKVAAPVVTALGVLWTGTRVAARILLWGSARGARLFEQSDSNPMGRVAEHFDWLLRTSRKPVVFLIDDLDRCKDVQVVELLEAIQTLVRDAPRRHDPDASLPPAAYFVIAADGAWLRKAYAAEYGATDSLGYQFLDKLFQLTVPMPALSATAQQRFLGRLLRPGSTESVPWQEVEQAKERIGDADGNEQAVVGTLAAMSPELRDAVAVDATNALLGASARTQREHILRKFAPLLPPNPRSIKLFLNNYTILRAVRTLEGVAVDIDSLALWTILRHRWPAVADVLQRDPDAVRGIIEPLWCTETFPDELQEAARSAELRAVVLHRPGGPLTADVIRQCCGTA